MDLVSVRRGNSDGESPMGQETDTTCHDMPMRTKGGRLDINV